MKKTLYTKLNRIRSNAVPVVCVILAISILAVPVVAQSIDASDNFEGGAADGWNGPAMDVVEESYDETYSLEQNDGYDDSGDPEPVQWDATGKLDLNESFTLEGTAYLADGDRNYQNRIGLITENDNGAMLLFSYVNNETYLSDSGTETDPPAEGTINKDFRDTWIRFEIYSSGNNTLQAKVWQADGEEPSSYQIQRDFEPTSAPVGINAGNVEDGRYIWLDKVSISGTTETDPTLLLDTGTFLEHGGTQPYTVYDLEGEDEKRIDISENATVTSENTSVITVDESNNQLTATSDESVNERVNITATYQGRTDIAHVTVASPTVDNLDILPFMYRISAMFLDRGFQMILVGLLLAIAATRVGGVFAGLGIYQMSLTAGWLIGWVPIGLAMVGLFATLFIGLNIAANIDYSVRR